MGLVMSRIKAELTQEGDNRLWYGDDSISKISKRIEQRLNRLSAGMSFGQWLASLNAGQLIDEYEKEIRSKSNSTSARERLSMFRLQISQRMTRS